MLKRLLALLLSVIMLLSLAACGGDDEDDDDDTSSGSSVKDKENEGEDEKEKEDEDEDPIDVSDYKPQVLLDDDNCTFTVDSIDYDGSDYEVHVTVSNKTDKDLVFTADYASVNNYMYDFSLYTEVGANEEVEDEFYLFELELDTINVSKVTDINFILRAYDANDYSADDLVYEEVSIYPYGQAQAGDYVPYDVKSDDVVLMDEKDVSVIAVDYREDDYSYDILLYIENNTDQYITFSNDYLSANDAMFSALLFQSVAPGKQAIESISILQDDLEEYGMDKITKVEFDISYYDAETLKDISKEPKQVTLYPLGEDKAESYVRQPGENDQVLVDNDQCSIIVTDARYNNSDDFVLHLFVVNKTERDMYVYCDEASINGTDISSLILEFLPAGKCSLSTNYWFSTELEDKNITDVSELEITLSVSYDDFLFSEAILEDTFVINP